MKVKDALETIDKIDEVKQVLYSADTEEGTHIEYDIVRKVLDLLHEYESYILQMDVIHK